MIFNITHAGSSRDFDVPVEDDVTDDDLRRIAMELAEPFWLGLAKNAFANYVIDRLEGRAYLRPKVPFGGEGNPS